MDSIEFGRMIHCPYEKSHFILRERFQLHLNKCRRNHHNVQLVECPFNITHVVHKPELDWHVSSCPDRKNFEQYKHTNDMVKATPAPPPPPPLQSSENWDDDEDVPTYNPQAYVKEAPVLRGIRGAPPSKRKQFRKEERLRFLNFNNN